MTSLRFIVPAAPVLVVSPPIGSEWLHEIKWDGWRLQIHRDVDVVRIYSRQNKDLTGLLPGIVAAVQTFKARSFILDAELVATGHFHDIRAAIKRKEVSAVIFDILFLNSDDLRPLPLSERRKYLTKLIGRGNGIIQISQVYPDGAKLLSVAGDYGMEGIVSKKLDSPYVSGRCRHWLKVKTTEWKLANKDRWKKFQKRRVI